MRTYTTAAPEKPGYQVFKPVVDVWCTQTFLPERDDALADMQARGVEYWCYPNDISGENDHTPVTGARMTYGFGFWRSGFLRAHPLDLHLQRSAIRSTTSTAASMDFFVRAEPDGTPMPVAMWEAYREGYDDMRYLYTLTQLIAQARQSDSAAPSEKPTPPSKCSTTPGAAIPVDPPVPIQRLLVPRRDGRPPLAHRRPRRATDKAAGEA